MALYNRNVAICVPRIINTVYGRQLSIAKFDITYSMQTHYIYFKNFTEIHKKRSFSKNLNSEMDDFHGVLVPPPFFSAKVVVRLFTLHIKFT